MNFRQSFSLSLALWATSVCRAAPDIQTPRISKRTARKVDEKGSLINAIMVPTREPKTAETKAYSKALRVFRLGAKTQAIEPLLTFLEQNPKSPWAGSAHLILGFAFKASGRQKYALDAFRSAAQLYDEVARAQKGAQELADWAVVEAAELEAKGGNKEGFARVANRMTSRARTATAMTTVGGRQFEYDAEDRLVSITMGTHVTEFAYDGLGFMREVVEKDNGLVSNDKRLLWDPMLSELVAEQAPAGTVLRQFFTQGFIDTDGTKLYYTRDHLGSIRELVDAQGSVRARYDYDPYGRVTKVSGDRDSLFQYTGMMWHAPSGLDLTINRPYDPNLGRWTQRDPIEEDGGLNLYAYVENDPINSIDPYGLKRVCFGHRTLVTAYASVGPGAYWPAFKPPKPGKPPGKVGPGDVACANTGKPPHQYPFNADVTVYDEDGNPYYTGHITDTGAGWDSDHHNVDPGHWIDIWKPRKPAINFGKHWMYVEICYDDGRPDDGKPSPTDKSCKCLK